MVSAGDLQQRYGNSSSQDVSSKRASPGLLIGCTIDVSTGVLAFSVNGKEVANKFQVEPGTKLFPAVICEPTIKEMLQFELGATRVGLSDDDILAFCHVQSIGYVAEIAECCSHRFTMRCLANQMFRNDIFCDIYDDFCVCYKEYTSCVLYASCVLDV